MGCRNCLGDAAGFCGVLKLVAYEVCEHIARADGIACHIAGLRGLQRHRLREAFGAKQKHQSAIDLQQGAI